MDSEEGTHGTRRSGRVKNKPKYTIEDDDDRVGDEDQEEVEEIEEKPKAKGRRKKGSDDEEDAYEESESSTSDVSEEYEEPSESPSSSDYEDAGFDDDEEEWDRRRRHFVQVGRYSSSSHRPGHDLPPFLAEAVSRTAATQPMPFIQGGSAPAMLTKEQIQEIAKNAVSTLASVNPLTGRKLPVLLPRAPAEQAEQIKSTVSAELRESIASLLMDPSTRASMIRQMQGASAVQSVSSSYPQQYPQHPLPPPRPMTHLAPRKITKTPRHHIEPELVSTVRPKRAAATKKIDYSGYFKDDDENDGRDESGSSEGESVGESEGGDRVEKILSHKRERGKEFLFVKFWGLSYLHCEWIPREELEQEKGMATRIKKFLAKPLAHHSATDIFNPDYTKLERIVYGWRHEDEDNPGKMAVSFLVKWVGLPYEDATWEKEQFVVEEIPNGAEHVAEYQRRPNVDDKRYGALPVGRRPDPQAWKPFEQSPDYKDGHQLRPYQLEGVNWLVFCWMNKQSCIIADEMGLGKTVQSVAFMDLLYQKFNVRGPFLIVCPLSTLPHWQREFESWTDLNVIVYHGSKASRDVMYEYEFFFKNAQDQPISGFTKFDVLITTYEMAMAGIEQLSNITWRVAVFDEAHRLKNRASKAADVLKGLEVEHKILLSGTPIQNSILELWSLLNFLQPQRFYSEEDFMEEFGDLETAEDVERLQELLKPLMLRRLKEDVEKSIPVKEETIIEVELTPVQKRYYRAILEKNFVFLTQGCSSTNAPNLLNAMMELRKCCIHPFLINGAEERILEELGVDPTNKDAVHRAMIQASGKLVLVDKLLARLRQGGHKVLIFSQMTRCLDILADYLRYCGYPMERIDGAVKGTERQASIDRFCDPEKDSFVFLLCTRAGGVGINLTAADTVVIFDSDWNPQNDLQAQARCHRIGQKKAVKIYRLITRNTYERDMFDRAGMKLGLDKAVLQKMVGAPTAPTTDGSGVGQQLSRKEVEILLKKGAYGVLMDTNDDASNKFCDEDIEQILERRTTIIRHDGPEPDGAETKKKSIFSKATFTATNADDFDIDIDDPNFWELWAKKLEMNPRALLAASSAASGAGVDEPRVKRLIKRLRTASLSDPFWTDKHETVLGKLGSKKKDTPIEWTVDEVLLLQRQLALHGIGRFQDLPALFPNRTKNDIVAGAKAILKAALDTIETASSGNGEDENEDDEQDDKQTIDKQTVDGKFKEDAEKAILWKFDFDKPTGKQSKQHDLTNFAKHEIPFAGASKNQCVEFKSLLCLLSEQSKVKLSVHLAKQLLLRVQVMEMIRQIVERNAGNLKAIQVPGSVAGAPMPNWWGKDADVDLIVGFYRHGYLSSEQLQHDPELVFSTMTYRDDSTGSVTYEWPSDEALDVRLRKLLVNMEKRAQVASKLAAHQLTVGERRSRTSNVPSVKESPVKEEKGRNKRKRRVDDSDSEDSEDSDLEMVPKKTRKPGKTQNTKRKTAADAIKEMRNELLERWTVKEKNEFHRIICLFGLPSVVQNHDSESEDEESPFFTGQKRDWSLFKTLGDFAADKTSARFNEYCEEYLGLIEQAVEQGTRGKFPLDKAKKAKHAIALFERLRKVDDDVLSKGLAKARRSAGLPKWWTSEQFDVPFLRAVAKYGLASPELIVLDKSLPFAAIHQHVLEDPNFITETTSASARRSTRTASQKTDDVAALIGWPNESVAIRRVEYLLDLIDGHHDVEEEEMEEEKAPSKKVKRAKSEKSE